jgi:NAD(P)-dependent dehydrogenase (short-subunit alcohol dehydrogenase family)
MSDLGGRHAIVTGANRGIGAAITRALSNAGASVTLMVRDPARAQAVADALTGPNAIVVADLTDRTAVHAACADAAGRLGPVDILVNNAGFTESAPFLKSGPDLFERMIAVHLMGAVHATQAVLPSMIERERGHVVNVASTAGLEGQAYVTAYVAAKHALVGLTRALALEVRKHGVSVNAVCPGYTDTQLVHDAVVRIAAKTGKSESESLRSILAGAGQQRLVTPGQVAAAVIALCTAPAGAPTGQAVVIDGSKP